jgi:hypothetical protein
MEQDTPSPTDDRFSLVTRGHGNWRITRSRDRSFRWGGTTGIYSNPEQRVRAKVAVWEYQTCWQCVATAKSLREAKWQATCRYVGHLLKEAGITGVEPFVQAACNRVGDWLPLQMLVWDYAWERNGEAADAVKQVFPKALSTAA